MANGEPTLAKYRRQLRVFLVISDNYGESADWMLPSRLAGMRRVAAETQQFASKLGVRDGEVNRVSVNLRPTEHGQHRSFLDAGVLQLLDRRCESLTLARQGQGCARASAPGARARPASGAALGSGLG